MRCAGCLRRKTKESAKDFAVFPTCDVAYLVVGCGASCFVSCFRLSVSVGLRYFAGVDDSARLYQVGVPACTIAHNMTRLQ